MPSTSLRCPFFKVVTDAIVHPLLHFVWPETCPVCGRIGVPCCDSCMRTVISPLPSFCVKCGAPYGFECCSGSIPCHALSLHEGLSRELLLNLKYKNIRSLGMPMGRLMGETFNDLYADILLPVPLHKYGRREYNQSLLLAEGVSQISKIPADDRILFWRNDIVPQAGKASSLRHMMPIDAIGASGSLKGVTAVLVDDVYTTGNTLRAAISAVEKAEGKVSSVLVWSRRIPSQENEAVWNRE
ncbi:MAG: phosphoribosyltransferase family protein [Synergistaceae bacterium]|nr:phosphoribosyltransferase family protein [Synergistaceae bacterium]